tara:strand:- start:1600 stop:2775 length:1176 start_codon:yes stop_codon:yes gene_type:complete
MINCKYCKKKFSSVSKFERHIRSNNCNCNTIAKNNINDNINDKKINNNNQINHYNINRFNQNIQPCNQNIQTYEQNIQPYNQNIQTYEQNINSNNINPNNINPNNINPNNINPNNINSNNINPNNIGILKNKYNTSEQKIEYKKMTNKIHQCKYCNKIYKYASGLSRHVKSCQDKKALEHFLGDKLKAKNMSLDEFIEIRDMHQSKQNQVITQQVINNNVINNNTTNVQINMINPFGKENVEHILKNKDLCMQILKKMDNGVNKLFLEVYNKDENRNFYKLDKTGKKIATLTKENRINHNEYEFVIEHIFSRMHNLYNKISENLKSICTDKVNSCISKNMHKHEKSGVANSNKKTFNDYLNYMSKMNEELITNMLLDNGYISSNGVPQLDV